MDLTTSLGQEIFARKYQGDSASWDDFCARLATALADGDQARESEFFALTNEQRAIPGGRILAYAGRPTSNVSLMNCTTHTIEGDSLAAIADAVAFSMAATSRGQGIGFDFSKLRPRGSLVNNAAKSSTGAISFMEMLNQVGKVIAQAGRRGALLFSLDISHPDLLNPNANGEDFLHIKGTPGVLEGANISVNITDEFMQAVKAELPWTFSFTVKSTAGDQVIEHTMPAKSVFDEIVACAHRNAEPGVLFKDTAVRMSNSDALADVLGRPEWKIVGVNACSEQWLAQHDSCNLGSLNLMAYVVNPFTEDAAFDLETFSLAVRSMVRMLDAVLDKEIAEERSATDTQATVIQDLRRLGIGIMGFTDALVALGLDYDPSDPSGMIDTIMRTLRDSAYLESIQLAKDYGACGAWAAAIEAGVGAEVVELGFYATLPEEIKAEIAQYGLRNVALLSIAPTGSISNLIGASAAAEPVFALEYTRTHRLTGAPVTETIVHPAVETSREMNISDLVWPTAYSVLPTTRVMMQAYLQKFVDSAISSTVNFPASASVGDVASVYMLAWELGCKGITVYVDQSRHEQVLTIIEQVASACPSCGEQALITEAGCSSCRSCGYSVCSL